MSLMGGASGRGARQSGFEWAILVPVVLLAAIGTTMLYSVAGGAFQPWADRHAMRFFVGLALLLVIARVPLAVWARLALPIYVLALGLLLVVSVAGVEASGARRWLRIAGMSLQPSELMKVALVAALGRYYDLLPAQRVSHPRAVLGALALIGMPAVLVLRQPDLGTALMFLAIGITAMLVAGVRLAYFLAGGALAAAVSPLLWHGLHAYQRRRIEIYIDPDSDPTGAGYHIAQSKIALGSGGLTGHGLVAGSQSRLDFVPEKHTDFIFAMLGEAWGFLGTATVIAIYALLVGMAMGLAYRAKRPLARILIAGLATTVFCYAFINVAMVSGLVPVVGVPLPFLSYGGSAMISLMALLGLALAAAAEGRRR